MKQPFRATNAMKASCNALLQVLQPFPEPPAASTRVPVEASTSPGTAAAGEAEAQLAGAVISAGDHPVRWRRVRCRPANWPGGHRRLAAPGRCSRHSPFCFPRSRQARAASSEVANGPTRCIERPGAVPIVGQPAALIPRLQWTSGSSGGGTKVACFAWIHAVSLARRPGPSLSGTGAPRSARNIGAVAPPISARLEPGRRPRSTRRSGEPTARGTRSSVTTAHLYGQDPRALPGSRCTGVHRDERRHCRRPCGHHPSLLVKVSAGP
jgi:hypothetical protein